MAERDVIEPTADGSKTVYSHRYRQTYHSVHGATRESTQIYTDGSGVRQRCVSGKACDVLEVGFGLGLNFLLTAAIAEHHKVPLNYHAIEHQPIDAQTFDALDFTSIGIADHLVAQCRQVFAEWVPADTTRRIVNEWVTLYLHPVDFTHWQSPHCDFHAVYLDAFSPDENPECWRSDRLQLLFECLVPGGTLVTYCAKGRIRRNLEAVGFSVERLPGPPGKRETLRAHRR